MNATWWQVNAKAMIPNAPNTSEPTHSSGTGSEGIYAGARMRIVIKIMGKQRTDKIDQRARDPIERDKHKGKI